MDQFLPDRLSGIQSLLQSIQNEIRVHGLAGLPAHDAPGTDAAQIRIPFPGSMATVTRWGDLHDLANRLAPSGADTVMNWEPACIGSIYSTTEDVLP